MCELRLAPHRIRKLRREAGISQRALAEQIGVHRATIMRIEAGVEVPRANLVAQISVILGVSLERLFVKIPCASPKSHPPPS